MNSLKEAAVVSWKTTLLGLALALLNAYANGTSPKQAALSVGLAALGALAKDHK